MATLQINGGWFGFGFSRGLFPEIRLGVLRLMVSGKTLELRMKDYEEALREAHRGLKIAHRQIKHLQFVNEQLELALDEAKPKRDGRGRFV